MNEHKGSSVILDSGTRSTDRVWRTQRSLHLRECQEKEDWKGNSLVVTAQARMVVRNRAKLMNSQNFETKSLPIRFHYALSARSKTRSLSTLKSSQMYCQAKIAK